MKLMEDEDVLMELRPERRVLVIWFLKTCLAIPVLLALLCLILHPFLEILEVGAGTKDKLLHFIVPLILAVAFVLMLMTFAYYVCLRRTYRYTITNRRCIFSGGILRRVRHSVPYHKITDVEMSQNILERMLGISSLGIYTPGTGSIKGSGRSPEIAYVGLKDNERPAEIILKILARFKATGQ